MIHLARYFKHMFVNKNNSQADRELLPSKVDVKFGAETLGHDNSSRIFWHINSNKSPLNKRHRIITAMLVTIKIIRYIISTINQTFPFIFPVIVEEFQTMPPGHPVIPEISAAASALLGEYGASDAAVLNVIFGVARPEGKLPFELPNSMEAVRDQKADVPYDSENPLYPFGFGLSY